MDPGGRENNGGLSQGATGDPLVGPPADDANPDPAAVRSSLLTWYAQHRRHLPWRAEPGTRAHPDPYAVLVAEFMLQQTRIDTVLPYYVRWMQTFPDLSSLANAEIEQVMQCWQGLGYYSRARRLHANAQHIMAHHGGQVPADVTALRALPGVGAYTAGAIASTAFGIPEPAIDGNAQRLLTRVWGIDEVVTSAAGRRRIDAAARSLLADPAVNPSNVNQAIMELAALVCTPRHPRCHECPLSGLCVGKRLGIEESLPRLAAKKAAREVQASVYILRRAGSDDLLIGRRSSHALLPDLWLFPMSIHHVTGADAAVLGQDSTGVGQDRLVAEFGIETETLRPADSVSHVLTHLRLNCTTYHGVADSRKLPRAHESYDEWRWLPETELTSLAISKLMRKLLPTDVGHPSALRHRTT